MSAGTFNILSATCGTTCPNCTGYTTYWIAPDPFGIDYGYDYQGAAYAQLENGYVADKTSVSTWSSDQTSIASVAGPGLYAGVAVGSFNASASATLLSSDHLDCMNRNPCPTNPNQGNSPGAVVKMLVYNSGAQISQNQSVSITAAPQMPNIQSQLAGASSGTTVSWSLNVAYTAADGVTYQAPFAGSTIGSAMWTVPWSTSFVGGTATLTATYQKVVLSFVFSIQGTNPLASAIDGYINGQGGPWFWPLMVSWESTYRQFNPVLPLFGGPHGFGLSQVDPPPVVSDLWGWQNNLNDGLALLNSKNGGAISWWNSQIQQWTQYNQQHPTSPFPRSGNLFGRGPLHVLLSGTTRHIRLRSRCMDKAVQRGGAQLHVVLRHGGHRQWPLLGR